MTTPRFEQGFSLIEMAVLLIIFGSILAMSFTLGSAWMDKEEFKATQLNIKTIEDAMDRYRRLTDRFPCPANLTLPTTDANYGFEAANAGTCTGGTPFANASGAGVVYGAIPTKTLNIGDNLMLDNWGNRLVYYIDTEMTQENALDMIAFGDPNIGDIIVRDKTATNRPVKAIYAIVSHGANGAGAIRKDGNTNPAPTDANQLENLNHGTNAIITQGIVDTTFDDIVSYKLRRNFRKPAWDVDGKVCVAGSYSWGPGSVCSGTYPVLAGGQSWQIIDPTPNPTGDALATCVNGTVQFSAATCTP